MKMMMLLRNIDFHDNIIGEQKYIPEFKSY